MRPLIATGAALLAMSPLPVQAEIVGSSETGFATRHSVLVAADPPSVWAQLEHPENWWHHTWSGNSANLALDMRAGGCFCETIPAQGDRAGGSVEHMRVIAVMPPRLLRMQGALGPLQGEGLAGTLTVTLREHALGTEIIWDYVIGGQARFDLQAMAPVVDRVQGEFLDGLALRLGGDIRDQ